MDGWWWWFSQCQRGQKRVLCQLVKLILCTTFNCMHIRFTFYSAAKWNIMALCGRDVGDDFRRRTRRRSRMTTNVSFGGGEVLRYGIIINW